MTIKMDFGQFGRGHFAASRVSPFCFDRGAPRLCNRSAASCLPIAAAAAAGKPCGAAAAANAAAAARPPSPAAAGHSSTRSERSTSISAPRRVVTPSSERHARGRHEPQQSGPARRVPGREPDLRAGADLGPAARRFARLRHQTGRHLRPRRRSACATSTAACSTRTSRSCPCRATCRARPDCCPASRCRCSIRTRAGSMPGTCRRWRRPSRPADRGGDPRDPAASVENFLNRVYYEFRNLGVTPQERALNYSATNAFQVSQVSRTRSATTWCWMAQRHEEPDLPPESTAGTWS